MPTTFYETYKRLCQRAGKSDNAVAAEIGLSNSTVTTWKQGALPRRPTIKKVADYFGVSTDYVMGTTIESQIDAIEDKIRHLSAVMDFTDDEAEREELEVDLEKLQKAHADLRSAKDRKKEKTPIPEDELKEQLIDNAYLRVMESAKEKGISPEDLQLAMDFIDRARRRDQQ